MSRHSEYQAAADRLTEEIKEKGLRPKLLLHACCAPCSSYVLEALSGNFELTVFYFNPNISPEEEYRKRAAELKRLTGCMDEAEGIRLIVGEYSVELFAEAVKGLENEPEGGSRCEACFRLRLGETARVAAENGFDYFTTTLTISPHKNAPLLNEIGYGLAREYGVQWFPSDFKKKGGFKRSIELSEKYGLYRQDYCGCIYSKLERERQQTAGSTAAERQ
ncbi:MAG: epoxyqueuosine reductase QueH [Lachnospiraceae bacterium]|nr:epoxyqueuosine reductase QueH [Lachnospiraceae bacterium]